MSEQHSSCDEHDQKIGAVEYRDIPGCPGYRVGSDGSVWSEKRRGTWKRDGIWRRMRPNKNGYGYLKIHLSVDGHSVYFAVHQLVLLAFRGPCPDGMEGAHDNGISTDNRLENLYWKTPIENIADKLRHGTMSKKLDEAKVRDIIELLADPKWSMTDIAKKHGISRSAVRSISEGKTWPSITNGSRQTVCGFVPRGEGKKQAKLTEDAVREIRRTPNRRGVTAAFARRFGVTACTINQVRRGRQWKHVT